MLEVIGKKLIHSEKKNKDFVELHCTTDFKGNCNYEGSAVETLFVGAEYDVPIGTIVEPIYTKGFNNQAILTELKVVQ